MAPQRHMEPAKVRAMGEAFQTAAGVLKIVSGVLEVQMQILRTTAFIGLVGGLAVERYLGMIKPEIDRMAKAAEELSQDAILSAVDWEKAQGEG